ncbi:hypothetical protein [Paenibacillus mendelii]|uniref:hypothetical protein n=1 Tax=Paenibacillus mendelii TaxID=206163 RepID=UPI00195D2493|nr:hypothetical protein [Paenibacillus mendelii]MCQ6563495.1 hypothetical protein [Paenibacillus mendelii]
MRHSYFYLKYAEVFWSGNPGLFFMLQAGVMVAARFALRTRIPSDGQWHPLLTSGLLVYMAADIDLLSLAVIGPEALMYAASRLIALGMALIYPILVTYLTFVVSVPPATY